MALTERENLILDCVTDGVKQLMEEREAYKQPVSLAVDTESLATVIRRQNDLIEKLMDSNAELKHGMAVLAEMLVELRSQITRPRDPVSLTIHHADGKISQVTG